MINSTRPNEQPSYSIPMGQLAATLNAVDPKTAKLVATYHVDNLDVDGHVNFVAHLKDADGKEWLYHADSNGKIDYDKPVIEIDVDQDGIADEFDLKKDNAYGDPNVIFNAAETKRPMLHVVPGNYTQLQHIQHTRQGDVISQRGSDTDFTQVHAVDVNQDGQQDILFNEYSEDKVINDDVEQMHYFGYKLAPTYVPAPTAEKKPEPETSGRLYDQPGNSTIDLGKSF